MKQTYEKIRDLFLSEFEKSQMKDKLTFFTAVYLPLADKLEKKNLDKEELRFLTYLILVYLIEILDYKEEFEVLFNLDPNDFKSNNKFEDLKKGVSLIINQDKIPEGVEKIMPMVAKQRSSAN